MQIEVKGRNVPVNDELRELVERKFRKVAAQVSDLARMEVEVREERNPALAGDATRDSPLLAGARAPGQARPREAPPAPRGAQRAGIAGVARHVDELLRRGGRSTAASVS